MDTCNCHQCTWLRASQMERSFIPALERCTCHYTDERVEDPKCHRHSKTADSEFLNWVADRLVHVYHESENVDFVLKLRELAKSRGV